MKNTIGCLLLCGFLLHTGGVLAQELKTHNSQPDQHIDEPAGREVIDSIGSPAEPRQTALAPVFHAQDAEDHRVLTRIKKLAPLARAIRVDGDIEDWSKLDEIPDLRDEEKIESGARDIVSMTVAPTSQSLQILLKTRDGLDMTAWTYVFEIDLVGDCRADMIMTLSEGGKEIYAGFYDTNHKKGQSILLMNTQVVYGDALELRVPYASIRTAMRQLLTQGWANRPLRPWVRVWSHTWDGDAAKYVDAGPVVATYRLDAKMQKIRAPLSENDAMLPAAQVQPLEMLLPLEGQWFLGQGAFTTRTHAGHWAYDLWIVDESLKASTILKSKKNDEYYAFGQFLIAREEMLVKAVQDAHQDIPARSRDLYHRPESNYIRLQLGHDYQIGLVHLKQHSSRVYVTQKLKKGDKIGKVGNSGYSMGPHLHLEAFKRGVDGRVPLRLKNVVVQMNLGDCPWKRVMTAWDPEEGMLVEHAGD